MDVKISELPLGVANVDAVVPVTNSEGTVTEKIRLGDIIDLMSPGSQGPQGPQGPQGDPQGPQGDQGSQGPQGFQGNQGAQGLQGNQGLQGFQGNQGSQGPQGSLGFQGSQGPQGFQGPQGSQGNQGSQGQVGATGPAGISAANPNVVTLSYAETVTTDASAGDFFDLTLIGNVTLANPTNPTNGRTIRWRITQDNVGGRTVTLGDKFNIPISATSPLPFSTLANKADILAATYSASRDKWDVVAFLYGY